jgi:hypothetical protein
VAVSLKFGKRRKAADLAVALGGCILLETPPAMADIVVMLLANSPIDAADPGS